MDLPSALNAPRLCYLGQRGFFVRALSLESWAIIAAWLDDHVQREDMDVIPATTDEAAQALLDQPVGGALMTWLGLREHGVTYEQAIVHWSEADEKQRLYFRWALTRRRKTFEPDSATGENIAQMWCGKGLASLVREFGFEQVCSMSLDQLEWIGSEGDLDHQKSPSARGFSQAMEMYEAAMKPWQWMLETELRWKASMN